jgi:hypothetical protein
MFKDLMMIFKFLLDCLFELRPYLLHYFLQIKKQLTSQFKHEPNWKINYEKQNLIYRSFQIFNQKILLLSQVLIFFNSGYVH